MLPVKICRVALLFVNCFFLKSRLTIKLLSLFLVSGFLIGLQFDDR